MPEVSHFALLAAVDDDKTGAPDVSGTVRRNRSSMGNSPSIEAEGELPVSTFICTFRLCRVVYWQGGICNYLLLNELWHTISKEDDLSDAA